MAEDLEQQCVEKGLPRAQAKLMRRVDMAKWLSKHGDKPAMIPSQPKEPLPAIAEEEAQEAKQVLQRQWEAKQNSQLIPTVATLLRAANGQRMLQTTAENIIAHAKHLEDTFAMYQKQLNQTGLWTDEESRYFVEQQEFVRRQLVAYGEEVRKFVEALSENVTRRMQASLELERMRKRVLGSDADHLPNPVAARTQQLRSVALLLQRPLELLDTYKT